MRAQLPVWSPVSAGILAGGLARALGADPRRLLSRVLAEEYGAERVVLSDSGTTALTLALHAVGVRPTVALPAYGCFDLVTAAVAADSRVRFYDLDPTTLAPEAGSLQRVLEAGVDAVVFVHFYGVPVDVRRWYAAVHAAGAVVIDDAAQGAGARIGDRPVGSLGDLGVLSFGRGKGRVGGHGGALLATSPKGVEIATTLKDGLAPIGMGAEAAGVAKVAAQWMLGRPALYGIPQAIPGLGLGETRYHAPRAARGMGRTAAGLVLAGTEANRTAVADRRRVAGWWSERLAPMRGAGIIRLAGTAEPGWLRYPVVLLEGRSRAVRSRAGRLAGIMSGYPRALPDVPALEGRMAGLLEEYPGAQQLIADLFTFPSHRWVTLGDVEGVVALLTNLDDGREPGSHGRS